MKLWQIRNNIVLVVFSCGVFLWRFPCSCGVFLMVFLLKEIPSNPDQIHILQRKPVDDTFIRTKLHVKYSPHLTVSSIGILYIERFVWNLRFFKTDLLLCIYLSANSFNYPTNTRIRIVLTINLIKDITDLFLQRVLV